jgi:hypothetical protein
MSTIDTNFLIYYLAGNERIVSFIERNKNSIYFLPTIVIAEFFSYQLIDEETINKFNDSLSAFVIVNLDEFVARMAADIRREYKVKLSDAIIAASALITNSILLTYNVKDFKKIKELKILAP